MTAETGIRFSGGPELLAALRQLPAAIGKSATAKALKSAVQPMVEDMQSRAPKDSGEGAESIHAATIDAPGKGLTVAVGPDRDHFYMAFPEWGTATQPARPWMRPSWDSHRKAILEGLGGEWWAQLAKAAKALAAKAPK